MLERQQDYGNVAPAFIELSEVDRQRPIRLDVSAERMSSGDSVDEDSSANGSATGREMRG